MQIILLRSTLICITYSSILLILGKTRTVARMQTYHLGENLFFMNTRKRQLTLVLLAPWKKGKRLWVHFHNSYWNLTCVEITHFGWPNCAETRPKHTLCAETQAAEWEVKSFLVFLEIHLWVMNLLSSVVYSAWGWNWDVFKKKLKRKWLSQLKVCIFFCYFSYDPECRTLTHTKWNTLR